MLKQLQLANFRVFNEAVSVRFRPITVLIGRNNSGKSSVIKFLLMLQQTLKDESADFLNPEGDRVKLGSFNDLKNSRSKKRNLDFMLGTESKISSQVEYLLGSFDSRPHVREETAKRVEAAAQQGTDTREVNNASFAYRATVPYGARRHGRHAMRVASSSGFDFEKADVIRGNGSSLMSFGRLVQDLAKSQNAAEFFDEKFPFVDLLTRNAKDREAQSADLAKLAEMITDMYTDAYLSAPRTEIKNLAHISPIRVTFSRVVELASPPKDSVEHDGKYATPHLMKILETDTKEAEIIRTYLERVADVEDVTFTDGTSGNNGNGMHVTAWAKNSKTKAVSRISEFGFGVSQVIPVVVQGVLMHPYTQMMVEQPEAQLHPTAQLELGSYFADLWNRRKVGAIIETHSANILLRLRRLIAKGELKAEDVSVAFFDLEGEMPVVKNLDIGADGSIQKGLPMEFFGADILEGLQLGAKK